MFTYTYAKYSTSDAAKYSTSDQLSLKIAEAGPGHIRISSNSIKFTLESEQHIFHTKESQVLYLWIYIVIQYFMTVFIRVRKTPTFQEWKISHA